MDPETLLGGSPADFDSAFAYALHGEMRRLLIVTIVGTLVFPIGLAMFLDPGFFLEGAGEALIRRTIGLLLTLAGAAFLFGGLIGALFKLITDANILAAVATAEE
jgi:hypothetical protein